ncbi:MAG: lipid-A-disaccharide synthase, partial [Myxococcota bacterium]
MTTILISAGDLSGERHGAALVREIRAKRPDVRFIGMGGSAMAEAGVELVVDQRELAVGGVFETLSSLGRVFRAWRQMLRCIRSSQPDLIVLVDSGGFNLPLARRARQLSQAKILYYVAPQLWAWRERRIRKLVDRTNRIAVILPFEKEFYAARGVEVDFVGHPLLDRVAEQDSRSAEERRRAARTRIGIQDGLKVLGLFPGSRRSEIDHHLEIQIQTFRTLRRGRSELRAVIGLAPTLERADIERRLASLTPEAREAVYVVCGDSTDALDASDVALAKPGTVTLELLLRGCPMVVIGRVHPWTAHIVRRSLRVEYLSMPNLLSGEEIVPERIQQEARPDRIAAAIAPLFEGAERERQVAALEVARKRLGAPGASHRTA